MQKINPFEHHYFLGYVSQVLPQFVKIHFPSSVLLNGFTHYGQDFNGGLIGSFVVIEGDKVGFLGRITELSLPESERLSLNEKAFQTSDFHPTGKIEVLLSFDLYNPFKAKKGLTAYPNIGAKIFVSSGKLVQKYLSNFGVKETDTNPPVVELGHLVSTPSTSVSVSLQSIFGRHCAVVGTTGGGKSYTISKLIESIISKKNKAILIDATGEYDGKYENATTINIGDGQHVFHYTQLTIDDMFFLLRPSPKTQTPKLMEAMRSLKIVKINNENNLEHNGNVIPVQDGLLKKSGTQKKPYEVYYYRNISKIEDGLATFDFMKLSRQLNEECAFDNGTSWGNISQTDISYCVSLMARINNIANTPEYDNIFGFKKLKDDKTDITVLLDKFLAEDNSMLLRMNFGDVPFDFQVREILANAIGKYLLTKARAKTFVNKPVIFLMDEAHQFLNKSVRDEYFEAKPLDAFDSIAKECRKHGLFLCLATQMPRDIPIGTLSQMGTFIVHRLITFNDKEAINNACSTANKNTLDFLPILGEGEAILTGVDFPMPIILKFDEPENRPNSKTPALSS
ncbi:MAG TPA: ATP-binding protein [Puia sp.]|uniref:ATP-binding protein n=1 Tax=Puia sp. TaxID=2045100 RepID=UPI002C06561F|nr:ATP-binding protein [Puia sp.]HVU97978.1 ATP-binding protein [Puia sp.]